MSERASLAPSNIAAPLKPFGKMPFGFGTRFFVMLLVGIVWIVPAWWSARMLPAAALWDLFVLAVFVFDLLQLPKPGKLEARRKWNGPLALGVPSEVSVEVHNAGRAAVRCRVVDETPSSLRAFPPTVEIIAGPRADGMGKYSVLPRQRGNANIGRLFVRYESNLGFAQKRAVAETAQTVRVLPDLDEARHQALYLIRSKQVDMEKRRRRQKGQGREFESLRDYRQGDELRDVCWTATARRHQLTTRVFEIERSQVVWIVLDTGRLLRAEVPQGSEGDLRLSKLDYAVNAALSLAQVATQSGDRVGLLAYGRGVRQNIAPGRGAVHIRTIVESLANVRGESSEADHSTAARVLLTEQRRRSLVVWITDFAETPTVPEVIEYAMQITKRHLVVFSAMNQPDLTALAQATPQNKTDMYRHAAALEIAHRRDLLLRGLRQRGVFAFELLPGQLTSSLVNQYLDIKERNLL